MRIAHHPGHTRQGGQLLRGPLRVAARDQNPRPGVGAVEPADELAGVVVGGGRDRAGVHHHQVGAAGVAAGTVAAGGQLLGQGRAVGLRGPAAEIFHVEPHLENSTRVGYGGQRGKKPHRRPSGGC